MNFRLLISLILLCVLIISCSSDDDAGDVATPIFGTYNLIAYNTNPATDINNDDNASENQALETDCHNSSFLTLNEDNTFSGRLTFLELQLDNNGLETQNIDCFFEDIEGTYTRDGNTLTFTYEFDAGNTTLIALLSDGRITTNSMDIDLLIRDASNNLVFVDATLILVLKK